MRIPSYTKAGLVTGEKQTGLTFWNMNQKVKMMEVVNGSVFYQGQYNKHLLEDIYVWRPKILIFIFFSIFRIILNKM